MHISDLDNLFMQKFPARADSVCDAVEKLVFRPVSTCQTLIEFTSKISLLLWQASRWIHSPSPSSSCLSVQKLVPVPPCFTASLLFLSFHFPPPVNSGPACHLALCPEARAARRWFIAEGSRSSEDEAGGWPGLKSLVAVYENVAWWMNVDSTHQSRSSTTMKQVSDPSSCWVESHSLSSKDFFFVLHPLHIKNERWLYNARWIYPQNCCTENLHNSLNAKVLLNILWKDWAPFRSEQTRLWAKASLC